MTEQTETERGELVKLSHELDGVIADCQNGGKFDAVCLRTVTRVRDAIAALSAQTVRGAQWMEEELKDGDRICAELGLERTEGGRLPMYKLLAKLRELKK